MNNVECEADAANLIDAISERGRCLIAFSGGVDSAVVAAAAFRARPPQADAEFSVAITADSPSVSREQLSTARRVAIEIGIAHDVVRTDEMDRDDYRANDRQRCFYCKSTLYATLSKVAKQKGISTIVSGTNADDLGDYRPGIAAGNQAGVVAPLAMLGLTKNRIRAIATYWNLSVADRPAQPCLSSRLAYGVEVTRERLQRVETAESFLAARGYSPLRVRLLEDDQASIEVAVDAIARLLESAEQNVITNHLLSLGFNSVIVDPRGFRSGSLNGLVQLAAAPMSP